MRQRTNTETNLSLLYLLLLLFCLCLGNGSQSLLCADGSGLVAAGSDSGEVGADDTALVLHGLARALLRDFLGDALLVHLAIDYCPGDFAGILALQKQRCIFRGGKAEDLKRLKVRIWMLWLE